MAPKLQTNFIPSGFGGINVRTVHTGWWYAIRHYVYQQSGYTCEICGASNCPVHAHEEWDWFSVQRELIQVLVDIQCLCETCHAFKHYVRSINHYRVTATRDDFLAYVTSIQQHAMNVNDWTAEELEQHLDHSISRVLRYNAMYTRSIDMSLAKTIHQRALALSTVQVAINGKDVD